MEYSFPNKKSITPPILAAAASAFNPSDLTSHPSPPLRLSRDQLKYCSEALVFFKNKLKNPVKVIIEYRGAKLLITEQFPDTAASIASIIVDSDVVSLDGRRDALETEAEIKEDGKLHVTVRRSNASRSDIYSRRSQGFSTTTPRPSNLTNAEIYSLQSSSVGCIVEAGASRRGVARGFR